MSSTIKLKRGDTFKLSNTVSNDVGSVNITGWTIKSQIRDTALISELTATITDAVHGKYTLEHVGTTDSWPIKKLRCDIQYTTDTGYIVSTETFLIDVEQDVTV